MILQSTMPQPIPLRFKVDDYYKMIELGMLEDYERAEIIEGELIRKVPIGEKHSAIVEKLAETLREKLGKSVSLRNQQPIKFSDYNEPQPDLAILHRRDDFYFYEKPVPNDVLLLIEVSDATLKYDRDTKLTLYAEAEIPEVWIVNLQHDIIEVHQKPNSGIYQLAKIFKRGETVISEVLPHLNLEVNEILI
ncbi:MAG TPA: Uma2 family endonuclease [Pyrinomonadaceae bacterium]|nr:Uma2 family endonuclease [Pyrinomonadaceae bacterium]